MKRVIVLLALVFAMILPAAVSGAEESLPAEIPADAQKVTIDEVRSGELIVVVIDGKRKIVSLIGIDAPDPKVKPLGECYAREATEYLAKLLPENTTVYLDPDMLDTNDKDHLLRFVWLPGEKDEKPVLVNGRMIRQGYAAWQEEEKNFTYEAVLERYEKEAKDRNRGIWKSCGGPHKKIQPTPTPAPTEDELKAQYPLLADVRELAIRPTGMIGQKISFYGSILDIAVAGPGREFVLGDENPTGYTAWIQVWVDAPDGSREVVSVGFDGDTSGMFKDSYIVVHATVVDTLSGTNGFGGSITQPLVAAEFVDLA
jgi:endonuclease YncB( thermonuclease family)